MGKSKESPDDQVYYRGNTALQKLFSHPDLTTSQASLDALIELKRRRQLYMANLIQADEANPMRTRPKVDLKLTADEAQAARQNLAGLTPEQVTLLTQVLDEQDLIIAARPQTFIQRVRHHNWAMTGRKGVVLGGSFLAFGPMIGCTADLVIQSHTLTVANTGKIYLLEYFSVVSVLLAKYGVYHLGGWLIGGVWSWATRSEPEDR